LEVLVESKANLEIVPRSLILALAKNKKGPEMKKIQLS
jgi:hypothetical protein